VKWVTEIVCVNRPSKSTQLLLGKFTVECKTAWWALEVRF